MDPFFDFKRPDRKYIQQIASVLRSQAGTHPERHELEGLAKGFISYAIPALKAIHSRFAEKHGGRTEFMPEVSIDYDPKAEPERFLKEVWGLQADHWALIETMQTYYLTIMSLLEKMRLPADRHLMLASLGSGPGLYETYLARVFGSSGIGGVISCIDFAAEMTETQRFVMSLEHPPLHNVVPITGDMTDIPLRSRSQDAVLCNNSLQWCTNWRKAISEMARVLDPTREPWAYIIVHHHKQAMHVRALEGQQLIDMQLVLMPQIMDELEKNLFTIVGSRQIHGSRGSGQAGGGLDRVLLEARYTPGGLRHSWRTAAKKVVGAQMLQGKQK